MTDQDFRTRTHEGRNPVRLTRDLIFSTEHIENLTKIVGPENVTADPYQRVKYAYGKTTEEMMELARGQVQEIPDLVIHPRHRLDVQKIVGYCNDKTSPSMCFPEGHRSPSVFGRQRAGSPLVLGTHMNRLLALNETNQTARVQPGNFGPGL